jgi:hypothetical protein
MRRFIYVLAWISLLGCGATSSAPTTPRRVEQPPPRQPEQATPIDIQQLVSAVEDVPFSSHEATHARVVTALQRLADVVRTSDAGAATNINRLAAQLTRSTPGERPHADLVQDALGLALNAFSTEVPTSPTPAVRDAYVFARQATARVAGEPPLADQAFQVASALRALTNVAALLNGVSPPFLQPEADVEVGHDASELRDRARRASSSILELAKERDWKRSGTKAARALDALAGVVAVAPLSLSRDRWRSLVTSIRYEALELEREGAVSLDRSDRVRSALLACVEALSSIDGSSRGEPLTLLVSNASSAVAALDPGATFVFQRGVIQEAFRTVADSFLVASMRPVNASTQPE